MHDRDAFAKLVEALRPWRGDLVFVGGWAHQLHRLHPDASRPLHKAVITRDADLAFAARARLEGDIGKALKTAGFRQELLGDHTPPVAHYHFDGSDDGFYAEFLVPLIGSANKRDGSPDATLAVAGVTAQKLRHLNVLLVAPWQIALKAGGEVPVKKPVTLLVANPVSFIAQKLLIHAARNANKRAQDALYVHDTLQLFGARAELLRSLWLEAVRPSLPRKVAASIPQLVSEQFGGVNDAIRSAVRIPQDRVITPAALQAACALGLNEVFASG